MGRLSVIPRRIQRLSIGCIFYGMGKNRYLNLLTTQVGEAHRNATERNCLKYTIFYTPMLKAWHGYVKLTRNNWKKKVNKFKFVGYNLFICILRCHVPKFVSVLILKQTWQLSWIRSIFFLTRQHQLKYSATNEWIYTVNRPSQFPRTNNKAPTATRHHCMATGCLATKTWLMRVMRRITNAEICWRDPVLFHQLSEDLSLPPGEKSWLWLVCWVINVQFLVK